VLYDVESEVEVEAFMPHMHPGGEVYLVLEGEVYDDEGVYPCGSIVWMDVGTTHNPKTRGKTLILVLWPDGVKVV
jgi:anti-sigma factor ChrR (cupin superfamily)